MWSTKPAHAPGIDPDPTLSLFAQGHAEREWVSESRNAGYFSFCSSEGLLPGSVFVFTLFFHAFFCQGEAIYSVMG